MILRILPKEGNLITLRLLRELITKLGITDEEHKEYDIVQKDGRISWDDQKASELKEFELGDATMGVIKDELNKLNKQNKLDMELLSLADKFID